MAKPLRGVRVLDLTHMLSGPYGAMILADLLQQMVATLVRLPIAVILLAHSLQEVMASLVRL